MVIGRGVVEPRAAADICTAAVLVCGYSKVVVLTSDVIKIDLQAELELLQLKDTDRRVCVTPKLAAVDPAHERDIQI